MAKRSYNSAGRGAHGDQPYDPNNSFVKKMATKMTDFIPQRLWISKWFNSPTSNGDLSNEDTDNPDETGETMLQPPAKRPRIRMDVTHPPGTFAIQPRGRNLKDQYPLRNDTVDFLDSETAGPSGSRSFMSSTPALSLNMVRSTLLQSNLVRQQTNGTANGMDENSESGESTSGCSSLIPQASRQDGLHQFHRKGLMEDKLSYTNHLQSPRSLFIDSISGARESMSSRRPSFNASMVNNEGHPLERGGNVLSSPFYSGNITFGGANASGTSAMRQNRRNLAGTSEFQLRVPKRSSVQVKPSNAPGVDSSGMSQTAKRILEALEHFSSPISDAKKIPVKTPGLNSSLARKRGRDEAFDQSPTSRVGLRHLTRELAVPTVPDMLKLKRRQRLQDTTLAARRIITAHSEPAPRTSTCSATASQEPSEYHLRSDSDSQKFFGKLRAKGKKKPDFEEQPEVVNLPSISLPITSLPSFDIPLPKPNYSTSTTTKATLESKSSSSPSKNYKFSSPIKLQNDTTSPVKSINHFTFSKPLNPRSSDKTQSQATKTPSSPSTVQNSMNFTFGCNQTPAANFMWSGSSTAPRPKEIEQVEKKKKKKDEDIELKSGSVMDVLSSFTKSDIWECSECFIKNIQNEEHCAACKNPKRKDFTKKLSSLSTLPSAEANETQFGAQFKMSTDKWECQCCLVRNPVAETKCVSCMTPKTDKKFETPILTSSTPVTTKSDLMDKFKPAKDSWECPGCMLRNPTNVISCPCCNASKPGLLKTPAAKKPEEVKSPLISTKTSSKTWECPSCMVRNDSSAATCVCCTTPNPQGSSKPPAVSATPTLPSLSTTTSGFGDKFKIPSGSWSCDTCMIQNKSDASECVACGGLKPGTTKSKTVDNSNKNDSAPKFNFGIPSSTAPTFQFGIPSNNKPEDNPKTDAPTNGFTFGVPVTQSPQSFTFGMPKTTQSEPAKTGSFTFAAPKPVEPFRPEEKKPEVQTLFNNISDTTVGFSFSKPEETKQEAPKDQNTTTPAAEKGEPIKSISFGVPIPSSTPENNPQSTPATTANTPTPSLFKFTKQPATTTESAPVLTFGQSTVPMGQTITTSISHETPKPSEGSESSQKPVLTFGKSESAPSVFGEKTTENKPLLTFGASTVNNTEKSAFPVENKLPSFGTIEQKTPVFGNSEKPMFNAPTPTFGATPVASTTAASTPATPAPLFGSSSTSGSMFGKATPIFGTPTAGNGVPPMFAVPKAAEPAPSSHPGLFFAFGTPSSSQPAPPPSTGNDVGFGGFGGFGTPSQGINSTPAPAFGFNAPKPEAPLTFGQTPSTPASSVFGNNQPSSASAFGTLGSGTLSSGTSGGFNFGSNAAPPSATPSIPPSSASTSGGFNFSGAPSGFNFNAPSQPSFNFTGGHAPTTFNATPQAATTPSTRKIKKAVRRMPPRA